MKKNMKYLAFLGFLGFRGLFYFFSHDVTDLFSLSYLAFFAYFFVGKISSETTDERYIENITKARSKVLMIPLLSLFLVGFLSSLGAVNQGLIILISTIGWTITLLTFAYLFYYYEKH